MDRFLVLFLRLCAITLGFILATIASAVAMGFLTQIITPQEASHLANSPWSIGLIVGFLVAAAFAGYIAFIPAMAVILFAEVTRKRDWLFYTLAGGIIALIVPFAGAAMTGATDRSVNTLVMIAVSGMIGGLTYWLFAGSRAGNWLPPQRQNTVNAPPSEES